MKLIFAMRFIPFHKVYQSVSGKKSTINKNKNKKNKKPQKLPAPVTYPHLIR